MFDQLYEHFRSNNLFYESQYGFKKIHSTELAALEIVDRIVQALDHGNIPINIYLDPSKAFDTLNHHILIYNLKYYGITGLANSLCASYLANRTQYVEFKNRQSKHTNINVGVPEGSIMGPLLFIIYINDIILSSNIFKFTLYADDTTLFTTIKSPDENNSHTQLINNELSKVTNWLLANKLPLNAAKPKFIVFSMPQNIINIPVLRLADSDIECVDSFNFLSITIDKHVNWVAHTNKVASRVSRTTGVLNRLKNVLPIYILKSIYTSLIMCHLNYGILVWGHNLNRLIIVEKKELCALYHVANILRILNPFSNS